MNLLKAFAKDREKVKSEVILGIVKSITDNYDHKFTYEEQSEMLETVNKKFLETHKNKRNKLITEAREIQNILTENKDGTDKSRVNRP